ncbi:CXXC-type zinc finger protein 1 [Armadillidium vulgare]|nr:CXXC-type zinc finger protein 1 [Armadillidium vulgare]
MKYRQGEPSNTCIVVLTSWRVRCLLVQCLKHESKETTCFVMPSIPLIEHTANVSESCCPEHTKESKISNTEVCGFPLTKDIFTDSGKVCRVSKKKCVKHYCWEKLRRADIDMERVRQCLKLDELVEQERQVRLAMTNRAGVLGLMLHSTYDHEYAAKMQQKQQQQHQHQQQAHHHQRQTGTSDHQYHQKDKSKLSIDMQQKHFKDSTNYYKHKLSTDHHYHRQQATAAVIIKRPSFIFKKISAKIFFYSKICTESDSPSSER